MKSLYFNEEHDLFRTSIKQFIEKEVLPYANQWEEDKKIDRALFKKLGDQGFLGINHEEQYGGSNADLFYSVIYLEELAKCGYGGVSAAVSVHQYMATNHLANAGSDELKQKYLTPSIYGDMVGAIAISEPGAGSDVSALRTTATKEGDEYVINGSKTFITNGVYGDFIVVACKTNPKAGVNGVSLIVVDKDTPGFTATPLKKLGWHSSDTGELAFDNVRVPTSNLVGGENMGFFYIMESFQLERLVAGIMATAGAEACLETTLKYMNEREVFGRPIKKYQVLRHDMVNMYTELEAAKQLVYNTCWKYEQGQIPVKETSMVKLFCTEMGNKIIDNCLQMFGGYGYMEEYPLARAYRDCRVSTIAGGTSQIMREILSKIILDDVKYKKIYDEEMNGGKPWGTPQTAKAIIESIPLRIKTDKANSYNTLFHFDISGATGGQFTVEIKNGQCIVTEGLKDNAECTVTSDAETYEKVELGEMAPEMAVMSGKLKVNNLPAMMKFSKLFNRV